MNLDFRSTSNSEADVNLLEIDIRPSSSTKLSYYDKLIIEFPTKGL